MVYKYKYKNIKMIEFKELMNMAKQGKWDAYVSYGITEDYGIGCIRVSNLVI